MILCYFLITSRVRLAVVSGADKVEGDSSFCKVMKCETFYISIRYIYMSLYVHQGMFVFFEWIAFPLDFGIWYSFSH